MLIKLNVSQRKSLSDLGVTRKLVGCMFACRNNMLISGKFKTWVISTVKVFTDGVYKKFELNVAAYCIITDLLVIWWKKGKYMCASIDACI